MHFGCNKVHSTCKLIVKQTSENVYVRYDYKLFVFQGFSVLPSLLVSAHIDVPRIGRFLECAEHSYMYVYIHASTCMCMCVNEAPKYLCR